MIWYLVFTVVTLTGPQPSMENYFRLFDSEAQCQTARDLINANPNNSAFAQCFYRQRGPQF